MRTPNGIDRLFRNIIQIIAIEIRGVIASIHLGNTFGIRVESFEQAKFATGAAANVKYGRDFEIFDEF